MKFKGLKRFNVGDRVVMANNRYGEAMPDVGTTGAITEICERTSCTRPGETLYRIAWEVRSGTFFWNIADSALVLEEEWKKKKR